MFLGDAGSDALVASSFFGCMKAAADPVIERLSFFDEAVKRHADQLRLCLGGCPRKGLLIRLPQDENVKILDGVCSCESDPCKVSVVRREPHMR